MSRWLLAVLLAGAGLAPAAERTARYHFGDDPRWSDASFDDSSWTPTKDGEWLAPPFEGSGVLWVRFRVPAPADYQGPLAIRLPLESSIGIPAMLWVNGFHAGGEGRFPPHPWQRVRSGNTVFDLPADSAIPGRTAVVALRIWYPPFARVNPGPVGYPVEIGSRELLRLRAASRIARDHLSLSLSTVENIVYLLLGAALLGVWRLGRGSRDLLWFAIYLLASGVNGMWQVVPAFFRPDMSFSSWSVVKYLAIWCMLASQLEFLWSVFGLSRRWFLHLLEGALGVVCVLLTWLNAATEPADWLPIASRNWNFVFTGVNVVVILISAWQLRAARVATRGVAAAMIVWSATLVLAEGVWGRLIPGAFQWGEISVSTEDSAEFLFVAAVGFLLLRRLWTTWHRARELDAEFEAARQMQQSLVPPASGAYGFTVASVYLPAKEVGGDFFWTVPVANGSLLLVAGDVSGKGLKAAMTVATLAGALRDWPFRQPAKVLAHLNSVLTGHGGTGFTTCCAALFNADGSATIANAGHVPPYCNGEEMEIESGLPLGLIPDAAYAEAVMTLRPGDGLTFVSDGVVEARNASQEIYGFDRMRALSTQPAARIAETACAFGQEDDISVITIERSAVVARAA